MKVRVVTLFSGYDSQCMGLDQLKEKYPDFDYELVAWSEIDKYAIQAHNAVYPQWADRNLGDVSKIDWEKVEGRIDLLTYSSPCFVAGTLVLTDKGYKLIENITPDDMVLTDNNEFRKVVTPMKKLYNKTMFDIESGIFDELKCTENHPLFVRSMTRKGHKGIRTFSDSFYMSPTEIRSSIAKSKKKIAYYIGYAINKESRIPEWDGSIDNRFGHHKHVNKLGELLDKECFWYLMGRYLGDGWKRESNCGSGIVICCGGRNEKELIDNMNECGINYTIVKERTVNKYQISMNELCNFVERFGYYAQGKKIDYDTLCLPKHLLRSFLQGVVDSDGCYTNGLFKVTSVSRELVYGIGQCVAKIYNRPFSIYKTIRPKTTKIEGRSVNQMDTYTIVWKLTTDTQDKMFYENGYLWSPIRKMEEYKAEEPIYVYNMEVEDVHSYTANGAIVHNCQDISAAGQQRGLEEGSGTRSSLLWECEKAIAAKRPHFLLMENVSALVSSKFIEYFEKWLKVLESYGYESYWKVLNTKDFDVPQNRQRVFCVSVLKYQFPTPPGLTQCLADVLEDNVDENHYLKDEKTEELLRKIELGKLNEAVDDE